MNAPVINLVDRVPPDFEALLMGVIQNPYPALIGLGAASLLLHFLSGRRRDRPMNNLEFVRSATAMALANPLAQGHRITHAVLVAKVNSTALATIEAAIHDRGYFSYPVSVFPLLSDRRKERGLSLEQVAFASGRTVSQVQKAEEGRGKPPMNILVPICRVLDLDPDVIGLPPDWLASVRRESTRGKGDNPS